MLILLPPSETKRDGGDGAPMDFGALSFSPLNPIRARLLDALGTLDDEDAVRALKLGPRQMGELARNRSLRTQPTLPALDRYTGVLYDALDAGSLSAAARAFAGEHVAVQSALFGLTGAMDGIPAYRLSAGSRLPGVGPLKRVWAKACTGALGEAPGLIVDLRSKAYAELGPLPAGRGVYVNVVQRGSDGVSRALNHFNKRAKGLFARALCEAGATVADATDPRELEQVAAAAGLGWRVTGPGEAELAVPA